MKYCLLCLSLLITGCVSALEFTYTPPVNVGMRMEFRASTTPATTASTMHGGMSDKISAN